MLSIAFCVVLTLISGRAAWTKRVWLFILSISLVPVRQDRADIFYLFLKFHSSHSPHCHRQKSKPFRRDLQDPKLNSHRHIHLHHMNKMHNLHRALERSRCFIQKYQNISYKRPGSCLSIRLPSKTHNWWYSYWISRQQLCTYFQINDGAWHGNSMLLGSHYHQDTKSYSLLQGHISAASEPLQLELLNGLL